MKILHIDSSILGGNSVSRLLSAKLVEKIKSTTPNTTVTYYDLAAHPISHLSAEVFAAQAADPAVRTPEQAREAETSAKVMEDFLAADIVVVGTPMYNFSVSSQLKAWIDRVAVAGKTFRYTVQGPEGLAGGKKVIVVSSRGGFYGEGTAVASFDHQESYLQTVFGFLGITDVEFIRAEGVGIDADHRQQAITKAEEQIEACKEKAACDGN